MTNNVWVFIEIKDYSFITFKWIPNFTAERWVNFSKPQVYYWT